MSTEGRIPASNLFTARTAHIRSGTKFPKQSQINNSNQECQPLLRNNCNHHPKYPTFKELKINKIPYQIQEAINLLSQAYFTPKSKLIDLQHHMLNGYIRRQVKSERRNIMLDILRFILYRMDYETRRIGWRRTCDGKWQDLSLVEIANALNVKLKRVKRAMKVITDKMYINAIQQYKTLEDGTKIALNSVRYITPKLFACLGLDWQKFFKLSEYKKDKRLAHEKKMNKITSRAGMNFISESLKSTFHKTGNTIKSIAKNINPIKSNYNAASDGRNIELAKAMYDKDPSRSLSDYLKKIIKNTS